MVDLYPLFMKPVMLAGSMGNAFFGVLQLRGIMSWKSFRNIFIRWMPRIALFHHRPWVRFDARYSRKEPYEVVPHVRICAGGSRVTGIPTATLASQNGSNGSFICHQAEK